MKSFQELSLSEPLLKLFKESGFNEPSEIQEKAIPLVLNGKDVIGSSLTGSGKTLAFGAGIIDKIQKNSELQVLVLTPTRELAEQVGNVFKKFSHYKKLDIALVYGGVSIEPQIRSLKHSEIVVGTPGRILDHLSRRTIDFSKLKTLVLDEADRMFDMGFIKDVEKIIKSCPKERQTLLFSATISDDIKQISKYYMKNPVSISAESYVDPEKMKQIYYDVSSSMKFSLLVYLLKKETSELVMIFCNTRHNTDFIAENLKRSGINSVAIHGGLAQNKRTKILESFHRKQIYVLVCTDVAARGLDIKGVSHVYNYDIPKTGKDYIHRIGRTARAGEEGVVINILCNKDYENFRNIKKEEPLEITREEVPKIEAISIRHEPYSEEKRERDYKERRHLRSRPRDKRSGRNDYTRGNKRPGNRQRRY